MSLLFFDAALLGLSVAAPVGPVSVVIMQRSLMVGSRSGIASGLGATTAHGLFALAGLVGAEMVAASLAEWHRPLRLMSAAVLVTLGLRTALRRPASGSAASVGSPGAAYGSALVLALSNPMTVLPYLAIASATLTGARPTLRGLLWGVPGAMCGAMLWYGTLTGGTTLLRRWLGSAVVVSNLNLVGGACLVGFGILVAMR